MTKKVTLLREDGLPMPLIELASAEDLAAWYASQLEVALDQGERALAISCFDHAPGGQTLVQTAYTVLRTVMDFLYAHPQVERLTVRCGDDASFRAYSFQWNMWFAAEKPHRGDTRLVPSNAASHIRPPGSQ